MTLSRPRPLALIILDGWGYRKEKAANAIAMANKPNWDTFCHTYFHTLIAGSGRCVGLPQGQMGNSEVGHLNMGAGRIVQQDLTRIDVAIEKGDFFENPILSSALKKASQSEHAIHVMTLLSPGGVHSHERHLHAFIKLAAQLKCKRIYIHAFLDGRDTPPRSARQSLQKLLSLCEQLACGKIVSLIGRYYAMDRDKRWERIQQAYELLVEGKASFRAENAIAGLDQAYERGETDEFVSATSIHEQGASPVTIDEGDFIFFMNFRSDRAREITQALIDPHFQGFDRVKWPHLGDFICLSEYDKNYHLQVAFPPQPLKAIFAECISKAGLRQLRIAETEKYAHVTFFFNGGIEPPYPGEARILIPSPRVATYDLLPEMSAFELTDRLIQEIKNNQYDVIICNFANADMVGHSGNLSATIKAIETVDTCLGLIAKAIQETGGEMIITADHGNAEQMYDLSNNQPHTAHTSEPVPFIYIGRKALLIKKDGKLSDIAPTLLYLMNLPIPPEMTGSSLVKLV